jgi:hypothetical protein
MAPIRTLLHFLIGSLVVPLAAQDRSPGDGGADSTLRFFTGVVCNNRYRPVTATHVINLNNHAGDVTDSLGIFRIPAGPADTLLVRNVAYMDTLVPLALVGPDRHIMIRKAVYPLQGARVFEWGSTYRDFSRAVIGMPEPGTLADALELPRQDPEYIPYDMDEAGLKSLGFLIKSPISYFYENYSRHAKSKRMVYWLNRNRDKVEAFDAITGPENISAITGLSGDDLLEFLAFLYQEMECDYKCEEIRIYSEIHALWDRYRDLKASGQ